MSEQELESNNPSTNNRRTYICYRCHREIEPLMAPNPTCPYCHDAFVEEVSNFKIINSDTAVSSIVLYKFCVSSDFYYLFKCLIKFRIYYIILIISS